VRFYLSDDAPILVDPERLAEAAAGPDWACEHCGAGNRALHEDCGGCGAPRGSSPGQMVVEYTLDDVPRSGAVPTAPRTVRAGAPPVSANEGRIGGFIVILLAVIGIGLCGGEGRKPTAPDRAAARALAAPVAEAPLTARDDEVPGTTEALSWARVVYLEARSIEDGEGWELPDSAEVLEESRKVRDHEERVASYREVERKVERKETVADGTDTRTRSVSERVRTGTRSYACGQRDRGNGYFEEIRCSEPVYETRTRSETYEVPRTREVTRYETEIDREPVYERVPIHGTYYRYRGPVWSRSRVLKEEGGTTTPMWPRVQLRKQEREATREELYAATFRTAAGERHQVLITRAEWDAYPPGSRVALRRSWRGRRGLAALSADSARITVLPPDSLAACRGPHAGGAAPSDSLRCSHAPRAGTGSAPAAPRAHGRGGAGSHGGAPTAPVWVHTSTGSSSA
jgi:hypothetical protein